MYNFGKKSHFWDTDICSFGKWIKLKKSACEQQSVSTLKISSKHSTTESSRFERKLNSFYGVLYLVTTHLWCIIEDLSLPQKPVIEL